MRFYKLLFLLKYLERTRTSAPADNWVETFRKVKPVDENQRVLSPGDIECEMTEDRMTNGIPLQQAVVDDLHVLGERFSVKL